MVRRIAGMTAGAGLATLAGSVVAGTVVAGTVVAGTVVAGTAVAGAGAAQAMPATSAAWHIVKRVHAGVAGDFTAVVATGKSTGWAFNGNSAAAPTAKPTAWRRNGSTWTRASFPGRRGEGVVAAGATSPSDVWAFTDVGVGSRVLRWNGHAWSVVKTFGQPLGGASVVSSKDVWVFGQPAINQQLGVWHYNGRRWSRVSTNLDGGSALSATSVWAFSGTSVYHYNGHDWAKTSVKRLLPPSNGLNNPELTGIYAQSAKSVYAIGNGQAQDDGGPTVVLHYNGHDWRKVAQGNFGYGTQPAQQISPDGHGGLWLPMPGFGGQASYLLHYSGGRLTSAGLPHGAQGIDVESVANVPGTSEMLGGGFTHESGNPGLAVVAVLLQYGG
jgi:hypothetical protein